MEGISLKAEKGPIHPDYKKVYEQIKPQILATIKASEGTRILSTEDESYRAKMKQRNKAFIGSGTNADAYSVVVDGRELIAKVGKSDRTVGGIGVLMSARGIPRVPQLVAYSDNENVVVMTKMPGLDFRAYKDKNVPIPAYTDDQIEDLLKTSILLENRGIQIDPKSSNFMYDEKEGFSIIDFNQREREDLKGPRPYSKNFRWIAQAFPSFTSTPKAYESLSEHDKIVEDYKTWMDSKIRFTTLIRDRFPRVWQEWKDAQGTKEGFLWQRLRDFPDHPELNSRFSKLEELGVAWDDKREGGIRSIGIEGLIQQKREAEKFVAERTANLPQNKEPDLEGWGTIQT